MNVLSRLVLVALYTVVPAVAAGQAVVGRVAIEGWDEPVAGAVVTLLDTALTPLASAEAGDDGRFALDRTGAGVFYVQARYGGLFSDMGGPVRVDGPDDVSRLALTFPSPLLALARRCFEAPRRPGTGVVAGMAYEPAGDLAIPGARVVVQWEREGEARGELETHADGAGRFVLCDVPAGVPLSAWVHALAGVTRVPGELAVEEHAIARVDVALDLGRVAAVRVVRSAEDAGGDAGGVAVVGRVVDAETGAPIAGAAVLVTGLDRHYVTDARGQFRFDGMAPGVHTLEIQRLGYDLPPSPLELPDAASVELEVRVTPVAVALAPLVVRGLSRAQREIRMRPVGTQTLMGETLRLAEARGAPVHELVRQMPGIVLNFGRFETEEGEQNGVCLESRRSMPRLTLPLERGSLPWCDMVAVVLDGVLVARPGELLANFIAQEFESIEYLPPLEATRYGLQASATGALVLWTRGRGPLVSPDRNPPRDR